MAAVLLDTNIVIYLFKKEKKYVDFVENYGEENIGISVVTYMEVLVGAKNDREESLIQGLIDRFEIIPLTVSVARDCAAWIRKRRQKSLRHPGFSDAVIGQTALALGTPLATNNPKDFAAFKELTVVVP